MSRAFVIANALGRPPAEAVKLFHLLRLSSDDTVLWNEEEPNLMKEPTGLDGLRKYGHRTGDRL